MSSLKTDAIEAATGTNTNLALTGKGTGKVALGDAALLVPDADGAAGQILTTDGSLALTFAATPGTSGNVLTSNGSAWTSAAAGGGATAIITRTAFTASSGVDLSLDNATYDSYKIITYMTASGTTDLFIRTSSDGGSSFDDGGSDYVLTGVTSLSNATTQTGVNTTGADHLPSMFSGGGSTGTPMMSIIEIVNPDAATRTQLFSRAATSGGITTRCEYMGQRESIADVDAVRLYPSTGNMTGIVTLIGYKNA